MSGERRRAGVLPLIGSLPVAVTLGETELLLPQDDVRAISSALDLQPTSTPVEGACGWVEADGARHPAYALDAELELIALAPAARPVCVVVTCGEDCIGVLADRVESLPVERLHLGLMPACLQAPGSPLEAIAWDEDRIMFTTTGIALGRWIDSRIIAASEVAAPARASA